MLLPVSQDPVIINIVVLVVQFYLCQIVHLWSNDSNSYSPVIGMRRREADGEKPK
jgi:hypothetical protein